MPFSIGAHPAFALAGNFENYSIAFEKEEPLEYYLLENDLISSKTATMQSNQKQIPLTYDLFENDALIFKKLQSNALTILEDSNPVLTVHFEDFPSLGIWTKMNAPFLCIEPWCGLADNINHNGDIFEKEGINLLQPQAVFSRTIKIEL